MKISRNLWATNGPTFSISILEKDKLSPLEHLTTWNQRETEPTFTLPFKSGTLLLQGLEPHLATLQVFSQPGLHFQMYYNIWKVPSFLGSQHVCLEYQFQRCCHMWLSEARARVEVRAEKGGKAGGETMPEWVPKVVLWHSFWHIMTPEYWCQKWCQMSNAPFFASVNLAIFAWLNLALFAWLKLPISEWAMVPKVTSFLSGCLCVTKLVTRCNFYIGLIF